MLTVTGSPAGPFVDALLAALKADEQLAALVGGRIFEALPDTTVIPKPFIVGSRHDAYPHRSAGSVVTDGRRVAIWLDYWSAHNGSYEVRQLMARARVVLPPTRTLDVLGFQMMHGSLVCEEEQAFPDFDRDMPQQSCYHGVQRWAAIVDEAL